MPLLVLDRNEVKRLIRQRRRTGADRRDEVWDGVYVMSPEADNQHQFLAGKFVSVFDQALGGLDGIRVFPSINISDRETGWKKNFRCPDVAVFLPGNPAQDRGTHWFGGPDFAVEVISPYDRTRLKLPFYARVGVRELLLVDRKPWALELYRGAEGAMESIGRSTLEQPAELPSAVLPLCFRLLPGEPRPRVEVSRAEGTLRWLA